ncbi:EamA-like transporter family protein [Volucribacter psittacicida]|uniref:EamA-like transporter family protein n=1 Tax=Volucribacter psittacicida TaxID=203482 RepID=A0A4R1G7R0_9PAST|nr:EamA family transporter [Volucribacter psittacicida]TCK01699.1 EamA-like transporter family protein [Volucribacter psittacicida]
MAFLILAVFFSVSVAILLKIVKSKALIQQAIAINYIVALAWCYFLLKPNLSHFASASYTYFLLLLGLGILLPAIFVFMAKAVQYAGIVRADAAQRLSLFLQILAALFFFNEQITTGKFIGIVLAFVAFFCLLNKPHQPQLQQIKTASLYLILVWFGYATIGILFKLIAKMGQNFPTALFFAFLFAGIMMLSYLFINKIQWQRQSLWLGLLLGSLNFCNILFYIKAHQHFHQNPTLVFAGMDIGVICLGTLIGAYYFKEKMSKLNGLGIGLGIISILCLFYLDLFI